MLQILKETTVWNADFKVRNHTYLLDGDKVVAYAVFSGKEIRLSPSKIKIDKRGRKFEFSNHPGLKKIRDSQKPDPDVRTFKVESGDKVYFVNLKKDNYSCTCTGFTFRGKCKHIDAVVAKIQQSSSVV
ncbi:MAG: SWIM zinc finger family protein [Flavobacteriales bacterium]